MESQIVVGRVGVSSAREIVGEVASGCFASPRTPTALEVPSRVGRYLLSTIHDLLSTIRSGYYPRRAGTQRWASLRAGLEVGVGEVGAGFADEEEGTGDEDGGDGFLI